MFLADDHAFYRSVVAQAVHRHPGLALVGEASDGEAALTGILETAPDVALLDLRMPGLDGVEVCTKLRATDPGVAAVLLTAFDDDKAPARARAAGARACLGKDATETEICDALLHAGDSAPPTRAEPTWNPTITTSPRKASP